jgi:L-ornithine Nalpha-acyltransferase
MKVRLANSVAEREAAQALRYQVFHEELGAPIANAALRDEDRYDAAADHLLVINEKAGGPFTLKDGALVGTYRLIPQAAAAGLGGFYSAAEFDLDPLLARHADLGFLELGRSCILKSARGTAVIERLWQGIWEYVRRHKVAVMLGCASFDGTDLVRHAEGLSVLAHHAAATGPWSVKARADRFQRMDLLPAGSFDAKRALTGLPPLVKGYLRLGCRFGEGCVIDRAFNCIDVLVVLPVSFISPRYFARFGAPD